jgi:hypothetical protein
MVWKGREEGAKAWLIGDFERSGSSEHILQVRFEDHFFSFFVFEVELAGAGFSSYSFGGGLSMVSLFRC